MNIAVIEDSPTDRSQLINYIKKYAKDNTALISIAEYESGEAFLEKVHNPLPDVAFLDIYMGGLNGMEVAYKIRKLNASCQIVFVTQTPDFAVQSYEVRAFHYILKPYEYQDIVNVVLLLGKSLQKSLRYIKVKEGREWRKILLSDIIYADYENHYVQIHTGSAIISTYMKFSEIEEKLRGCQEFLSCYRCILVNMAKIKKVDDLFFLMCNGEYVPINRKHVKEIKAQYIDYIFDTIENDDMGGA